jgi:ATP-binding cassette, subfamily B (MDR/TAP), member 1
MEVADVDTPEFPVKSSFVSLFRYATKLDYLLIFVSVIAAIGMGVIQPLFFVVLSSFFNSYGTNTSVDDFYNSSLTVVYTLIGFGGGFIILGWIAVSFFVIVGARIGKSFRENYFDTILKLDPSWLDNKAIAELPQSLANDSLKIERATGDKLVMLIFIGSMVIASIIIAFVFGTQLAVIALGFAPFMLIGLVLLNKGTEQSSKASDKSYSKAAGIAEEALQEIRTVASLNGQRHETKKYIRSLGDNQKQMIKSGFQIGLGMGLAIFFFFTMNASMFMIGARFMEDDVYNWAGNGKYDIGKIATVMFVFVICINQLAVLVPGLKIVSDGQISAGKVYKILEEKSQLTHGSLKNDISGVIKFDNVRFSYPSAKTTEVLKGLSFELGKGDRLGIVGQTGSGKSTVIQLLLRYYEQSSGTIYIDGVDIKQFDIKYLRDNISVVSQEPILFNTNIYENIRYGRMTANENEIKQASESAGAYEFIKTLPDGFQTQCGTKGSHLSGGQKQRIAIARAIIRKPKILLLDEATSALDRTTEKLVVEAIETSLGDCTRITIAQNLLTVRNSTNIILIEKGEVREMGSHKRLMKNKAGYYNLYKMQELQMVSEDAAEAKDMEINQLITENEEKDPVDDKKLKDVAFSRMKVLGKSERKWLLIGCLGSVLCGFFYPLSGMLSGLEIAVLGGNDASNRLRDSLTYGWILILFGFLSFLGVVIQASSYPRMGANVTKKMRELSFKAMISYETGFYDLPENNCSALSANLNSDCEKVSGLSGNILGIMIGLISSLVVAHGSAAYFSWRMSLVVLAIVPLLIFALSANFLAQMQGLIKFEYESCTAIAADAIINYRTVKAFNLESEMKRRYLEPVTLEFNAIKKKASIAGFTYGLGFGLILFIYALLFWYGAKLVKDNLNGYNDMITSMLDAIGGSNAFFVASVYAPDMKSGIDAGKRIFKILEYVPKINVSSKEGLRQNIQGKIEFNSVDFSYPNRSYLANKNVNFILNPGESLGIIGRTGSGKSTIMQLILRHYDTTRGEVRIDDINITEYNIKFLRSQISVVSQEPVLFSGTIRENIKYGIRATDEQIIDAAVKAQASAFIESHEDGYQREVGIKGSRLSGGQKQRIAIARAIIRKPKILLMDEATSALDADTESEVLKNIRDLMIEATCIIIAHRLKTIDSCDYVMVMDSGKVSEIGKRDELKTSGGYYSKMISGI